MKKEVLQINLEQAAGQLTHVLTLLKQNPSTNFERLEPELKDLFENMNIAWNSRKYSIDEFMETVNNGSEKYLKLKEFPKDLKMN